MVHVLYYSHHGGVTSIIRGINPLNINRLDLKKPLDIEGKALFLTLIRGKVGLNYPNSRGVF